MVDLSAGMLLIRCRNEACRALAACAPAAEGNCSDVKRCICRCIHACRCMHAGSAGKLVRANRKCGALRFRPRSMCHDALSIQTENGLDIRPREFSEINRAIIEFPLAIIAADRQIEKMRRANVGLFRSSRGLE